MRDKQIKHNVQAHDSVSSKYDDIHGEIFNPIEQARLRAQLALAMQWITTSNEPKGVLDYGCGSGNLTHHLLALGCHVVSADVSPRFLRIIAARFGTSGSVETLKLNGRDLSNVADGSFDMTASYSVLHHVPDYLLAIRELARVTRSGGVIYLDHEFSEGYWKRDSDYTTFLATVQPTPKKHWGRFFILSNYVTLIRRKFNARYQPEGDIHVWPDDHIDWRKVAAVLRQNGCHVVHEQDYLLFKRGYAPEVYEQYRMKCHDTHLMIAKKE